MKIRLFMILAVLFYGFQCSSQWREFKKYAKRCVVVSTDDKVHHYRNNCAGYRTQLPIELIPTFDGYRDDRIILMLATPNTVNSTGDSLRNALSIFTENVTKVTKQDLEQRCREKKMEITDRPSDHPDCINSFYFTSNWGNGKETLKGIVSFFKGKDNLITLDYVATVSTYEKNLHYFDTIEKALAILEQ